MLNPTSNFTKHSSISSMRFNPTSLIFSIAFRTRTTFLPLNPSSSSIQSSIFTLMDSSSSKEGSRRLINIAQQLRLYKAPPTSFDDEIEEENGGKVVSQVGFAESSTPITVQPERFRPKKAAVLICLFEDDHGVLRVILTKRSSKLSSHSGEVSLPGGKAEEGDASDAETALREAEEEIGLEPSIVNVVTVLEPFLSKKVSQTISDVETITEDFLKKHNEYLLRVVPVIGILSDKSLYKPSPNIDEVETIFDVPLEMFLKDENRRSEEREWLGDKYVIHYFDYETPDGKYLIWGLIAGILIRAASVVFERPPSFLEQTLNFKVPKVVKGDTFIP